MAFPGHFANLPATMPSPHPTLFVSPLALSQTPFRILSSRPLRWSCAVYRPLSRHVPHLSVQPTSPRPPHPVRDLSHGLLSSTVGSLIGAGGGVVLTPLLTLTRLAQHEAHGTSLLVVAITALVSALRYFTRARVDLPAAAALMAAALLAAPAGARASASLDAKRLKRCFGAFLLFVSFAIPLLPKVAMLSPVALPSTVRIPVLAVVGMLSGFLSGLLGIGGGTINVPTLVLLGFSQTVAQGTALMAMVLPSIRGAYTHFKLGHVRTERLPGLVAGALLGGFLGASTALRLQEGTLRVVCSGIFAMIGVKYLLPGKKS
ncbi:unnamed protein product [Chondrus crispus]|uniref:Membrane transporter protein n=1 Tax=Chondrus crispus TaxID=2769 RepID=R7QU47_CHOCR|nr:unnamed protein product [Chondrus crispus]CDF40885.1 unnamed protein product [Chondrus crispus]|eukprot:XP_005711179.1 unnamed protein product [Chondrus crispus]